jgi:hypothetical protein
MNLINCLLDVTDAGFSWDITEDGFTESSKIEACRMAGINPDEMSQFPSD